MRLRASPYKSVALSNLWYCWLDKPVIPLQLEYYMRIYEYVLRFYCNIEQRFVATFFFLFLWVIQTDRKKWTSTDVRHPNAHIQTRRRRKEKKQTEEEMRPLSFLPMRSFRFIYAQMTWFTFSVISLVFYLYALLFHDSRINQFIFSVASFFSTLCLVSCSTKHRSSSVTWTYRQQWGSPWIILI